MRDVVGFIAFVFLLCSPLLMLVWVAKPSLIKINGVIFARKQILLIYLLFSIGLSMLILFAAIGGVSAFVCLAMSFIAFAVGAAKVGEYAKSQTNTPASQTTESQTLQEQIALESQRADKLQELLVRQQQELNKSNSLLILAKNEKQALIDQSLREQYKQKNEPKTDLVSETPDIKQTAIQKTTSTDRDAHGQPAPAFRFHAVVERQIDEALGIIKGIVSDGIIMQEEVEFLVNWMEANRESKNQFPMSVLYPRLIEALKDGKIDADEESEVLELLMKTVGNNTAHNIGESSNATKLPLDMPPPNIEFNNRVFCFTGKFYSGTRKWCEDQTRLRGGSAVKDVTKAVDYLVIGELGSRDWMHSTHGRKIEKAIAYRDDGCQIKILDEKHWCDFAAI